MVIYNNHKNILENNNTYHQSHTFILAKNYFWFNLNESVLEYIYMIV